MLEDIVVIDKLSRNGSKKATEQCLHSVCFWKALLVAVSKMSLHVRSGDPDCLDHHPNISVKNFLL